MTNLTRLNISICIDPAIRRICAYTVGVAALNEEGLYSTFYRQCVPTLCESLLHKPASTTEDEDELLAYENVVSALGKIMANDTTGVVDGNTILPVWLAALPIKLDIDEMEHCYSLLLDLIARYVFRYPTLRMS